MQKESLLVSMPKLILVIVLIICIGAVMGLMGYVLTGQYKTDHLIESSSVKERISMQISTDKEEYDIGENIKIKVSLTNTSLNSIRYSEPNCLGGGENWLPGDIRVATRYGSINLYQEGIKGLNVVCSAGTSSVESLETREGNYEWNQKVYPRSFNVQAPSGEYKISATFCEFVGYSEKQNCHSISTMIKIKGNAKEFLTKDEAIKMALLDEEAKEWYENHRGANFKNLLRYENGECYVKSSLLWFSVSDHLCDSGFDPETYLRTENGKCYRLIKPRSNWKQIPFDRCKEMENTDPRTIGGVLVEEDSKYIWHVFFSGLEIKKRVSNIFDLPNSTEEQIKNLREGPDEIGVKIDAYSGKFLKIKECGYECRKKYHHF